MPKIPENVASAPEAQALSALTTGDFQEANGRFAKGKHWRRRKPHWDVSWLAEEYLVKLRSSSDIAEEAGITENAVYYWLHKHGIPTRSTSEVRSIKHWAVAGKQNGMYGRTGSSNPNWKGGVTPDRQLFYVSLEWKHVCSYVWKRDNATCQVCKMHTSVAGCSMAIHHIESFAVVEKRCDPLNLVLLCIDCHRWVHSRRNTARVFLKGDNK